MPASTNFWFLTHRVAAQIVGGTKVIPWYLSGGIAAANCIAAYKPIGAASLAASYTNLANPGTYDATAPTAAPTFDTATGWTFDGASQYLDTGITFATTAGPNRTIIVKFDSVPGSTGYMCGGWTTAGNGFIMTPNRSGARKYYNGGTSLTGAVVASGVMAIAGATAYYNGTSDGAITTGNFAATLSIYLGANWQNSGSPPIHTYCVCRIQAVAIYSVALTEAQIIAVTNAMTGAGF